MVNLLRTLLIGAVLSTAAGASPGVVGPLTSSVAQADETVSLVYQGQIFDIDSVMSPNGRFLSLQGLAELLKTAGGYSLQTRPDRGHVVIAELPTGTVAKISDFKARDLSLVVGESTLSTRAEVRDGIPYLTVSSFQGVLEALSFSVQMDDSAQLIAVAKIPVIQAPVEQRQVAVPEAGHYPGSGFQESLLEGVNQALLGMGQEPAPGQLPQYAPQPAVKVQATSSTKTTSSAGVCMSMDELRGAWAITEPSAQEKATFKRLAEAFQSMQPDQMDSGLVDELMDGLQSFKGKVDQRASATKSWQVTKETAQVRKLGVQFMDLYQGTMDTMVDTTQMMQDGDSMSNEKLNALKEQLQEMEGQIHGLGSMFNAEVKRVRTTHGCGPATLKSPFS